MTAIIALVCPTCGSDLTGLSTDSVFGCHECKVAYEPSPEGLEGPYPIVHAKVATDRNHVTLPFWRLSVQPFLLPEQSEQPQFTYVPAFDLRRRSYFGDPGLAWTVERLTIEVEPCREDLRGMSVTFDDANKLGHYSVLSSIDKQQDITGFDLDIQFENPTILLVDFDDKSSSLTDPITLTSYPAPAFCDLILLRSKA